MLKIDHELRVQKLLSQFHSFAALFILIHILFAVCDPDASASFIPGHAYTPVHDGYILQWDEDLNQIGKFRVPGVQTATGASFGPDGNLVFIGRRVDGVYVIEVDSAGKLIQQYDTKMGSLNGGSYIDYDPVTERYAFAADEHIVILDRDLKFVTTTSGYDFTRSSGVAWGPAGNLFATDSIDDDLLQFSADLAFDQIGFIGDAPTGMDYNGGLLYLTLAGNGSLLRHDPVTKDTDFVVAGLGFGEMLDVVVQPDGNLLTTTDGNLLRLFSPDGMLLDVSEPNIYTGDGIAYYVPAPGAYLLFVPACFLRSRRRRKSTASN